MTQLAKTDDNGNTQTQIEPVSESTAIVNMIERVAMNPDADIDKMERLMQMRLDMEDREAERSFNTALVSAQSEMPKIAKKAYNKQTSSQYETLDDVIDQIKPVYNRHGFSVSFNTFVATQDGHDGMIGILSHSGGFSREYKAEIPRSGMGIKGNRMMTETHGFASTTTYGRRYLMKMIWNISTGEDTDGNAAVAFINSDQFIELRDLIDNAGTPVETVLKAYGAGSLEQFPLNKLESARTRLALTIKEKGPK